MKQYTLTEDMVGYKSGQVFVGPLPILGQSNLGYYPKGTEDTAPSTQCLFQSAVEGSSVFKLVTE